MIDVLKRLAELDSQNPNIVKENLGLDECGPMGMMSGMEKPSTPATINICLLYTSPSPRDRTRSRMPSSA